MRDWKTRLKIIWLLLTNQYCRSIERATFDSPMIGVMRLWTKHGDVNIKISVTRSNE